MRCVNLNPGDLLVTKEPTCISTILGSCVSICLFDESTHIGGMNHYMLPDVSVSNFHGDTPNKYGRDAIQNLLKEFKKLGCKLTNLRAKVIGGGNVIDGLHNTISGDIGLHNLKIAKEMLEKFGIPVISKNIGGTHGRKVEFFSHTGELRFKIIQPTQPQALANKKFNKLKILIIDDSRPIRLLLRKIIESTQDMEVVGEAADPLEAMAIRKTIKPDVITLDIHMPNMDGISYLKQYMPTYPVPTIIISSYSSDDSTRMLEALEAGAFDHMGKPTFDAIDEYAQKLLEKIRLANISVGKMSTFSNNIIGAKVVKFPTGSLILDNTIIAIGASTGGTEAIRKVLTQFDEQIPAIVIVQHIPPVFSKAFADRLSSLCRFTVKEAEHGDEVKKGMVFIAPGNKHMRFKEIAGIIKIEITDEAPVNKFRPSVDYMFSSLANLKNSRRNINIVAALLTGMGCDGAQGLLDLRQLGAETIAQDERSSVVFGMPREAIAKNAACHVVSIEDIAQKIADCIIRIEKQRYSKSA